MASVYAEDFDDGPGGWMRVVDNYSPIAALPIRDGAVRCQGPWWVDYNHAPPGGGYLQLLMCLVTRGAPGELTREVAGENRFIAGNYPTDFTNAKITIEAARRSSKRRGRSLSVLLQGSVDGICSGWVLTGQTFDGDPRVERADRDLRARREPVDQPRLAPRPHRHLWRKAVARRARQRQRQHPHHHVPGAAAADGTHRRRSAPAAGRARLSDLAIEHRAGVSSRSTAWPSSSRHEPLSAHRPRHGLPALARRRHAGRSRCSDGPSPIW